MNAKILNGEEIAGKILWDVKKRASRKHLRLAIVQVGQNPVSETYIRKKQEAGKSIGVGFRLVRLAQDISQQKLKEEIQNIGRNPKVSGMIVQLPLPKIMNTQEVLDTIPVEKDVDVLSSESFGRFALGLSPILPPTVGAVSALLEAANVQVRGKNVVLVGGGRLVGLPLAVWLLREKATVTVANEYTKHIAQITRQADILISGVGKPKLITAKMIKKGAMVIDAGTSVEGGRTKGDVDFPSVIKKAGYITPVPGGVGPLTVACLLRNLVVLQEG